MKMFVLFIFSSLIFKIVSTEKQYNMQRGKIYKAFPKLKDRFLSQNNHKLYKAYKHTTTPTLHMIDNEDCEFPLENNVAEMLLDNQDAEISGESKGIKRFIQAGYGQFSSRTSDRITGNYLINTNVKDPEYKTMVTNVIPNSNKRDKLDHIKFNNIQKREFILSESPQKNTTEYNDTEKYGKESLKESNIADIINNNIYNNDDRGQYYKNDLRSDYMEYRPSIESVSKKELNKILKKDDALGIVAEDYISDDSISLFETTNVGKPLSQIKSTLTTTQQLPTSTQPKLSNEITSSKIALHSELTSSNWKSNEKLNHFTITTNTHTEKGKCTINVPLRKRTTENIHTNSQDLSSNKTHKNQGKQETSCLELTPTTISYSQNVSVLKTQTTNYSNGTIALTTNRDSTVMIQTVGPEKNGGTSKLDRQTNSTSVSNSLALPISTLSPTTYSNSKTIVEALSYPTNLSSQTNSNPVSHSFTKSINQAQTTNRNSKSMAQTLSYSTNLSIQTNFNSVSHSLMTPISFALTTYSNLKGISQTLPYHTNLSTKTHLNPVSHFLTSLSSQPRWVSEKTEPNFFDGLLHFLHNSSEFSITSYPSSKNYNHLSFNTNVSSDEMFVNSTSTEYSHTKGMQFSSTSKYHQDKGTARPILAQTSYNPSLQHAIVNKKLGLNEENKNTVKVETKIPNSFEILSPTRPLCSPKQYKNLKSRYTFFPVSRHYNATVTPKSIYYAFHKKTTNSNLPLYSLEQKKHSKSRYTFFPLERYYNVTVTHKSIYHAFHKNTTNSNIGQKHTFYFVSGTPSNSLKTTKNKLRGLIEKISNKTEILKKTSSTKSPILVQSHHHGQTKIINSSPLPMIKKLFGKAVSKAPKSIRPITIHREGCLSPKPHKPFPIRHKGGDTGNHYYHGKRMKNTHEHAQPTTLMYASHEKPSANVADDEPSNEPIISKKKKVNINITTCNVEDSTCTECEINDIKDILPQPLPKKNLHL